MEWEKIFANYQSDKISISRIYKEVLQSNNKTTRLKNGQGLEQIFFKENVQVANKCIKRFSASLIIGEIQIKATMRYHFILIQMAII